MSISVQVLDISEYNELPTWANGYTIVTVNYYTGRNVSLPGPYTLGTETFNSIYFTGSGWLQFINTAYPTGSTEYVETISTFLTKYGIAIPWDLYSSSGTVGYKYANNNTQFIINYNTYVYGNTSYRIEAKVTINLNNHPTSPRSIRIALGRIQNTSDGLFGLSYGPASTVPSGNTMNYVVSDTPTNFVYPNVPVQLFSGTGNNYLTNKTIVYNIQVPNRTPVLSNNITISEIYGETIYNVDLNNYTTDLDSSLTDVVYTLNPNGVSGMPNNTTLRFWMRDSYGGGASGDTWNGGNAVIRNSSNSVVATLTGPSVNNPLWIYQDIVLSGINTITWNSGSYPAEPQLFVTSPSYSWATSNGDPPSLGPNVYYRTIGISNRTDTLNITPTKPLLGVSISGSVLTLNSTLYNCDEFYITANNTGITYTSNIATCSFTRLTGEQIAEAVASAISGPGELTSAIVTSSLNNNPRPRVMIIGYSSIGANAFLNASTVTSISIPSSVTSIGANAFQGMTGLTSITIRSSVTSIGANAFQGSGIKSVIIEYGRLVIPASAFQDATTVTSVTIPATVTSIGTSAFQGMTGLTSITIPSSVKGIGASAFQGMTGLTSITIPSSVTSIGANAFQGMTSLTSISIPSSVTSIGSNAFQGSGIKSVIIQSGMLVIPPSAFQDATTVTSITIPSSVTSIGANAFLNSGLTSAIFSVNTYFSTLGIINTSASQTFFGKTGVTVSALDTKIFSGSAAVALSGATAQLDNKTNVVIEGYTNIAEGAFLNASNITQVIIPSTVTSIGIDAFRQATSLTSINIPASVTSIGAYAFAYTSKLESILVDENNNYYSSLNGALFNKEKTILLKYPTGNTAVSYTVPMSVETIEGRSFSILNYSDNNTLRTIILNSGLIKIDTFAFRYVGILSITIPAGVTSIGVGAFYGATSLTSLTFAQGSQLTSIETNTFATARALTSITIPAGVTSIGAYAFQGATRLTSISIPSSVTSIGDGAFQDATSLSSITFAEGSKLTSIGNDAFYNTALTSITIPSSVTSIGQGAFSYASSLTSITIPASVTSIGNWMFNGALALTSITISSGVTSIGEGMFYNTPSLTSITIPTSVTSIGNYAFYNATSLTSITIPASVTSIGQEAFLNASKLTSITIPSSVISIGSNAFLSSGLTQASINTARLGVTNFPTALGANQTIGGKSGVTILALSYEFNGAGELTQAIVTNANFVSNNISNVVISGYTSIGNSAFYGASALTSITIPSSVTSIGASAFQGMTGLTSITIPSSVTSIGSSAFQGMTGLTSITIPSSVTSIGASAFKGMTGLTSITIPSSVTSIGANAFQGATSLTSITIPASVTSIGEVAFEGATKLTSVIFEVGTQLTSIGDFAFAATTMLTSITIPLGVTRIGVGTFASTTSLTSITIPLGVISIGNYAFQGASKLTSVIFEVGSQLTSIGNQVFQSASKLTSITIPSGVTSIGDYAFANTTMLTSVIFEADSQLTSIKGGAFSSSGLTSITIPSSVTSIGESAFQGSPLTTALFESASTVNTLGLPYGDLINGYIVSSFYDKSSVTIRYTAAAAVAAALAAIAAAPGAVISNSTFTSLLTEMNVNISNITSEIVPRTNDPYVEYSAMLTIPEGVLSDLTELNKINIIDTVKYLYATQLGVNVNKIIVTLSSGSIIANVNVLKDGITEAMVPICFPKGTPVTTNQGVIAIEKLNPDIHTIRGKKIVAITQTRPLHKYIISIEKDAFGKNVPSAPIQISKEHKVYYKGKMVKAKDLVEVCEGVTRIPYSGETLYNVLMEQHDKMMINNVICETLDPKNIMAKICGGKYNRTEQANICKELNDIIKTDNVPAYKKLYASLK